MPAWIRGAALMAAITCALGVGAVSVLAQRGERRAAESSPGATPVTVTARSLNSFERVGGSARRYGRLEFIGGLLLASEDKRFGGLSGLIMSPDGKRMLAVTDEGNWLSATVGYRDRAPAGLSNVRMGPLLDLNGRPLTRKRDSDAEAITLQSGNLDRGVALVAFERSHRIARYPILDSALGRPAGLIALPQETRGMRPNAGIEAMAVVAGGPSRGAIVAFSEELISRDGHHTGWLLAGGRPRRLQLEERSGFSITGAAPLPDGALLVLERRYRVLEGVKMQMRLLSPEEIRSGGVMKGETLISVDMTKEIDNMEGIAIHKGPRGETVITLLSDDNFNRFLQRNILLQFVLHPGAEKPPEGPR